MEHLSKEEIDKMKQQLITAAKDGESALNSNYKDKRERKGPAIPKWLMERKYFSLNFVIPDNAADNYGPLGEVAATTQEHQLLDDILNLMLCCQGMYITAVLSTNGTLTSFSVDSSIETSLRSLVNRILPLCKYYSQVVSFIEERSTHYYHGMVNHALASAMRNLQRDYMLLVTQLESQQNQGTLTLHRLWFYIEKTLALMELLSGVSTYIQNKKCVGGEVLSVLHDKALSLTGCGQLQDVLIYLTEAASVPYIKMLSLWIYRGIIVDNYNEFMVVDYEKEKIEEELSNLNDEDEEFFQASDILSSPPGGTSDDIWADDYWENRYKISEPCVPTFLRPQVDMILRTGKYLNVIRESDAAVSCPEKEELHYHFRDKKYVEIIEKNYNFASMRLLKLLMKEKDLMGRLRSIKHYFLLDQGDFIVQFLSLCKNELSKNIDSVVPSRLKSLLELCLRTSASSDHAYKDDIRCTLLPYSLISQMFQILSIETEKENEFRNVPETLELSGLEGFSLTYNVEWPMSLVIDRKSVFCYQLIFRHLFYCKYVEGLLCRVWVSNKANKGVSSSTYTEAFALRQRMINFIQNLEYYMNFEVIERHWLSFITKMQSVENVDEVLICHSEFIKGCLKDCMLTSPELLKIVCDLTKTCKEFANFILSEETEDFVLTIKRLDVEFTGKLLTLMDRIMAMGRENYNDALIHLLYRLDFNNYYSERSDTLMRNSPDSTSSS